MTEPTDCYGDPAAGRTYVDQHVGEPSVPLDDMEGALGVHDADCPSCGDGGPHAATAATLDGRATVLECAYCYRLFDAP